MPLILHPMTSFATSLAAAVRRQAANLGRARFEHSEGDASWRTAHYENVLGTSMQLTLRAAGEVQADRAEQALMAEIDRHDGLLSAWRADSEFSRWLGTRGTEEAVSPELHEVLGLFDRWRERTGGAINPAVEAATRVWESAAGGQRIPTADELAEAVRAMQQPHWRLGEGTAARMSDAPLVLASLTKSYIAGRAVDAALSAGASGAMLNIGGDIVVRGDMTQIVQVTDPRGERDGGVARSRCGIAAWRRVDRIGEGLR